MEISGEKATSAIRSQTSFKSRIPQKVDETNHDTKIPKSPTAERFQSKIPRSTSFKRSSSVKQGVEVDLQQSVSVLNHENELNISNQLQSKTQLNNLDQDTFSTKNDKEHRDYEKSESDHEVSNKKSYEYHKDFSTDIPTVLNGDFEDLPKTPKEKIQNSVDDWLYTKHSGNQTYAKTDILTQSAYQNIQEQLLTNEALTSTPTSKDSGVFSESVSDFDTFDNNNDHTLYTYSMENEGHTLKKPERFSIPTDCKAENGFSNCHEDTQNDDFERTEHDNDDYSTVTTTEYEKDGKVVRTTETINYTNDRNIKTRVTTTEKVITIPYGQQLDLSNPEITSSTTVRSKYLQTMLQSREFEGDKEVKAEKFETIETDIQTNKVDSNDDTNDPDLDTILVIVETLDELRTTEPKIKTFSGITTDDQNYLEIVDVLNKSLTKFEKIEPKDKESVAQKRQNGIEYIQRLIKQLNDKLVENQKSEAVVNNHNKTPKSKDGTEIAPEPEQKVQAAIVENSQKPSVNETEPELQSKKGRKKSTLKKHFRLGSNDKKNGDVQEKKKKKKLCVIS